MVEIEDIVDRESLLDWLVEQPRWTSEIIAHRTAMRVLPIYWFWAQMNKSTRKLDLTAMSVLRASLISGFVARSSTSEITKELRSVANAASASAFASADTAPYASAAADAAYAAAYAADSTASVDTAYAADTGYAYALDTASAVDTAVDAAHTVYSASTNMWNTLRSDCSLLGVANNLGGEALWLNEKNHFAEQWNEIKVVLAEDDVDWQFWIKWYEATLFGQPLPYDMLERIALEVAEKDWIQGPRHVNGLIAGIEAEYLRDATPLCERLSVDESSGEVFSEPIEAKQPDLLAVHLQRIEDALNRTIKHNGLTNESLEADILRDLFSKYSHDPERVEMDLVEVVGSLNKQITNDWLPDSPVINSLMSSCRQAALDIRAMNPELAENRAKRVRQAAREMTGEEKAKLENGIEAIKPLLREDLREQFESDFKRLINDAIGPLPEGAPPLPAPDPAMRMANRIAKVSLMARLDETVKKLKKNPLYHAAEVATQTAALVALFYSIFSLIA